MNEKINIKSLIKKNNFRPSKIKGQNFLLDHNIARKIVNLSQLTKHDKVLEIGTGFGILTKNIISVTKLIISIEIDSKLISIIKKLFGNSLFFGVSQYPLLLHADILKIVKFNNFLPNILISSLPYRCAMPIMMHCFNNFSSIKKGVFIIQEEIADRLIAKPGNKSYGALTLKIASFGYVKKINTFNGHIFWPRPKVKSSIISFKKKNILCKKINSIRKDLFHIINVIFSQRRKSIKVNLSKIIKNRKKILNILEIADINPLERGENLILEDFIKLTKIYLNKQ